MTSWKGENKELYQKEDEDMIKSPLFWLIVVPFAILCLPIALLISLKRKIFGYHDKNIPRT